MLRLEDLARALGGQIDSDDNRYLETEVGGLRALVGTHADSAALDLFVFLPPQHQGHPNFNGEWVLDDERVIPRLENNFVFVTCRRGVLFARSTTTEPSLEEVISTLWRLATWARKPWRPMEPRDYPLKEQPQRFPNLGHWIYRIVVMLFLLYCVFLLAWCASYQTT